MVAVTYGVAATAESKSASKRKSFFKTLFDAIAYAQMQRAQRELARYHYLIAQDGERDAYRSW